MLSPPPCLQVVILVAVFLTICNYINAQVKVKSNGYVGIGTTNPGSPFQVHVSSTKFSFPSGMYSPTPLLLDCYYDQTRFYPYTNQKGYLGISSKFWLWCYITNGRFDYCTAFLFGTISDARLKKNIEPVKNPLEKVMKIQAYKFDLDLSELESEHYHDMDTALLNDHYGFLAQELLDIYPEMVKYDTALKAYTVDYISFVPILLAAIQEQNVKIQNLEKELRIDEGDTKSTDPEAIMPQSQQAATLGKNKPNPFSENTTIEYYLPSTVQKAVFYIYDLQGKQVKSMNVTGREKGVLTILGNELQPGMYHYTLIADGTVIGTEKMILTD